MRFSQIRSKTASTPWVPENSFIFQKCIPILSHYTYQHDYTQLKFFYYSKLGKFFLKRTRFKGFLYIQFFQTFSFRFEVINCLVLNTRKIFEIRSSHVNTYNNSFFKFKLLLEVKKLHITHYKSFSYKYSHYMKQGRLKTFKHT